MSETRICTKCHIQKPTGEFYLQRGKYFRPNCKTCENARSREYDRKNRARRREQNREWTLRKQFGISGDDYRELLQKQQGTCAICGQQCPSGRQLAVDHDHRTGAVRGLLCGNCNNGLGRFKDSPVLLRRAANYLEQQCQTETENHDPAGSA